MGSVVKTCIDCWYYGMPNPDNLKDFGEIDTVKDYCHRYPLEVSKQEHEWCGEFKVRSPNEIV